MGSAAGAREKGKALPALKPCNATPTLALDRAIKGTEDNTVATGECAGDAPVADMKKCWC